jgi:hypothetical protein
MLARLDELETDLLGRRARAEAENWLGEIEGIDLTLTFLRDKREDTRRRTQRPAVDLGMPALPRKDAKARRQPTAIPSTLLSPRDPHAPDAAPPGGRRGRPPRSDSTVAVAWLAAETIRYLNYATRTGAGVQHASTLYTVAGALSLAADRIPQLSGQAVNWLEAHSGRLANDDGSPVCDTLDYAALSSQAAADTARLLALQPARTTKSARRHQQQSRLSSGRKSTWLTSSAPPHSGTGTCDHTVSTRSARLRTTQVGPHW